MKFNWLHARSAVFKSRKFTMVNEDSHSTDLSVLDEEGHSTRQGHLT